MLAGDAGDVPAEGPCAPQNEPWTLLRPSASYISGEVIESDVAVEIAAGEASSSAAEVRLHSCLLPAARSWGR